MVMSYEGYGDNALEDAGHCGNGCCSDHMCITGRCKYKLGIDVTDHGFLRKSSSIPCIAYAVRWWLRIVAAVLMVPGMRCR